MDVYTVFFVIILDDNSLQQSMENVLKTCSLSSVDSIETLTGSKQRDELIRDRKREPLERQRLIHLFFLVFFISQQGGRRDDAERGRRDAPDQRELLRPLGVEPEDRRTGRRPAQG